ncbi:UNVERIFIED_CONTAM: Retrovirus-related Pol polyprotein from transposon RE1 [Sesamum radiatum]|uniref:Retrovirus-related Pol polyprotein from transposon RE1 n=1 Tax=Sesamum radiatum TaxID=300843 RepID=A0AAW2P3K0_SESRA
MVCDHLLASDSVPTLSNALSRVLKVATGSSDSSSSSGTTTESSAMGVHGRDRSSSRGLGGRGRGSNSSTNSRYCTHCGRMNHVVDKCLIKHGKPEWANTVISGGEPAALDPSPNPSESVTLSHEEYEQLLHHPVANSATPTTSSSPSAFVASHDVTFFESTPYYSPNSSPTIPHTSVPLPVPTLTIPPHTEPPTRSLQVYCRCNCSTNTTLTAPPSLPPTAAPGNPSATPANDLPIALRKGKRSCTAHPLAHSFSFQYLSPNYRAFFVSLSSVFIPNTYHEALRHPAWKMAMDDEMSALILRGTWELEEIPLNTDVVACRWVFTLKFRADGTLESLPRVLFSLAVNLNWSMYQTDIKNAFLYVDLNETVYMEQPPGYVAQGEKQRMVCKLKKAIYGLKQSPRAWFDKFSRIIGEFGFSRCQADHSVFVQTTTSGMVILAVYVDDILITGSDIVGIEEAKTYLQKHFVTKDLGRPSQFMDKPRSVHWEAALRILKYIKASLGKGLLFKRHGHVKIEAYSDADHAGAKDDRKSTSGYCTYVGGNLVTWRSKKQTTVARSSAEAEYLAMAHTTSEILWLKNLLKELGFMYDDPIHIHCDNQAAIHIASNPIFHERTKHIEVDCHFVHEAVMSQKICTPFTPSSEQRADIFTKALGGKQFDVLCNKLGMIDIFAPA